MLRFKVFENGTPAKSADLDGAYLVGNDRVPMRAELEFKQGEIQCDPRARGAAALSILWPVEGVGRLMLETTRLLDDRPPHNLHVELARGYLMRIGQKREDWGLYDFAEGQSLYDEIDAARDLLIKAMTASDDADAAALADQALAAGVKVGEAVGTFHAEIFFKRRHAASQLAKRPLGCCLDPASDWKERTRALSQAFDFVRVPFSWRAIEPKRGKPDAAAVEPCLRALRQHKLNIRGAALLSFDTPHVPKWLPAASKSFKHLRESVSEHLKYVLKQFGPSVKSWEVISGVHAHNPLQLTFEQIMELTRMSAILVKQMAPRSTAIVDITLPWGEYYAQDPRTIPPMLYAEMVVQSGINFDAFGLEVRFGGEGSRHYVRDMLQISAMLDRFGNLGKPVHVTAAGVPSAGSNTEGSWRGAWSEDLQARWVRDFYQIALSKPFVETVCWQALSDAGDGSHAGGLLRPDASPKPAYEELLKLHRKLKTTPKGEPAMDTSRENPQSS